MKRTRSQITSNLYVSNWKSSYEVNDVIFGEFSFNIGYKCKLNFTMVHSFKGRNSHGRTDIFSLEIKNIFYIFQKLYQNRSYLLMSAVPCGFWGIGPISLFQLGSHIVLQLVPVGKELVKHFGKCWYKLFWIIAAFSRK